MSVRTLPEQHLFREKGWRTETRITTLKEPSPYTRPHSTCKGLDLESSGTTELEDGKDILWKVDPSTTENRTRVFPLCVSRLYGVVRGGLGSHFVSTIDSGLLDV